MNKILSSYLFRSSFIYALSSAVTSALPVILMPITTRYLSTQDYGVLGLFTMAITILSAFTGLSLHGAISRQFFDQENVDFATYITNCMLVLLVSCLTFALGVLLFSEQVQRFLPVSGAYQGLIILISGSQFLITVRLVLWQMKKEPTKYLLMKIAQSIGMAGLTIFLLLKLNWGWQSQAVAQGLTFAMVAVYALFSLMREGLLSKKLSWPYIKHALHFSLPLIPIEVGGIAIASVNSFLVAHLLGASETGIYVAGAQMGAGMLLVTSAVNKAFVPWLFEHLKANTQESKKKIVRFTYSYWLFLVLLGLLFSLLAKILVRLWVGPHFQQVASLIPWIAFGGVFQGMYYTICNYFHFERKTGLLAVLMMVSAVFNIGAVYFLTLEWGLVGAAAATTFSYFLCFVLNYIYCRKIIAMPW